MKVTKTEVVPIYKPINITLENEEEYRLLTRILTEQTVRSFVGIGFSGDSYYTDMDVFKNKLNKEIERVRAL